MTADRQQVRVSAAAVFCGSCLLFLIQPLLGRTLLPLFGGSAAVWTICLAAYQLLLLAGYAYAHGIARRRRSAQRVAHLSLLCAASVWVVAFAALRPALRTMAGNTEQPALEVLLCVLACAGLPYVALSAGSTVVQGWLAAREDGGGTDASTGSAASVYRLYAVSNFGSFAGLLVYPFVLEPFVSLSVQWWAVALGLCGYTGLMACLGRFVRDGEGGAVMVEEADSPELAVRRPVRVWTWYVLPGVTSFLLNAIVAHLFTDVTPLPLVWVAMLSAFLLSYVVGFSSWRWLTSSVGIILAVVSLCVAAVVQGWWGAGSFLPNAAAGLGVLFFGGSVLHGWLYEERPEMARLSRYYLAIAAGGAVGGLLTSLVAPCVFTRVTEYPLALSLCALLLTLRLPWLRRLRRLRVAHPVFAACCAALWLALFGAMSRYTASNTLFQARNFYGTVRVTQTLELFDQAGALPVHYLWCGQTTHGLQVRSPLFAGRGTSYYGATGGGIAFSSHPAYREGRGVKAGIVGLGAGCLACYGRPQDLFRFYEINPLMIQVAGDPQYFSFLNDAPMRIDLVPGDARKMLEREQAAGDPRYDILMIDAYSGDAVPYHLATLEAFRLYFERLEEDGILAMHVSNWHVDLLPLCKAVSQALGVHPYGVVGVAENSFTADAMWVFMTRHPHRYLFPGQASAREVAWEHVRDIAVSADEKGSLLPLLRY